MPADVVKEDGRERAGGVVDDGANSSAIFALTFKAFNDSTFSGGGCAADEAAKTGGIAHELKVKG